MIASKSGGNEVRRRRQAAGLTLQEFADASDLSRRMLGAIELGKANPSLATVGKLADGLQTELLTLLRSHRSGAVVVNTPHASRDDWASSDGSRATLAVVSSKRPPVEVWDWTLVPGDGYNAEPDPEGSEEMILVIEGMLSLTVDTALVGRLGAGASARLASDRQYSYRNDEAVPVRFIRIAHPAV